MSSRRTRPPRIFSSSLSATERRIYGAVTLIFVGAFLATMWPIAPLFSRIRPFVLGIPFSLFALVFLDCGFGRRPSTYDRSPVSVPVRGLGFGVLRPPVGKGTVYE